MPSSGVQTCARSEEHTSELQSLTNLVCRLLLEKKLRNASSDIVWGECNSGCLNTEDNCPIGYRRRLELIFPGLFFFNDTATTEIYTLSLHAALPISKALREPLDKLKDKLKSAAIVPPSIEA